MNVFKSYIFEISASAKKDEAISQLSHPTYKIIIFYSASSKATKVRNIWFLSPHVLSK
jgi:hypothetical protein